ncbi:tetratricopeptide repeat protein [Streptomyces sp. NPDC048420]|uniref:tetratricopeptide repeat protein n=1 Tax=Streptomyces sp. NPDC048420 TaxID=3155755 RepID=UPI00342C6E1E
MKRRRLRAGLAAVAAVATGVTVWGLQSQSATAPESKAASEERNAQQADTLLQAAIMQQQYQDARGAARTYRRVLEMDPENKVAWYNLGVIAQQDGRTTDARAAYEKSLRIDPKYTSALFNEAVLLKSSEPERAIALLKRAIATNSQAATAHLQLGQILAEKDRGDEAEDEFRRAVAADPSLHAQVPKPFRDSVTPSPTSSQARSTG